MWLRTEPIISADTEIVLLTNGHPVTKLGEANDPAWWHIRTSFQGTELDGFSKKTLMAAAAGPATVPDSSSELIDRTLNVLHSVAPGAKDVYLQAIRAGAPLFTIQETGGFTVLRESMSYSVPRMLEIFGVGKHSAKITAAEAPALAHNEQALAERVYGPGNPKKAQELGNTQAGDGFRYRGNGVLQTIGRGAHRRMGAACGLDFEGHPELVTQPEHALKPALQEWSDGNLNAAADVNDIRHITLIINGGLNGFSERQGFLGRLLPLLNA